MTVLTTEVLIFEANDAFRNNPDLVIPAFKVALKADGVHLPGYYGKQFEDPSTWGYIILNWDNYEAHKALIDGPTYPDVVNGLKPGLAEGGKVEMYHVQFSVPTFALLEEPITEVLILTLKAPENRATVVEILTKFSEANKNLVFGQTREDANKYILLCGWQTIEAHQETVARPEVVPALEKLYTLADRNHFYHTKLSQYRL